MYNFHASASAYAEYWNNTFGTEQISVTRRQIWQAFVQQSVRTIAQECEIDAEFDDGLNIKEVTTQAWVRMELSELQTNMHVLNILRNIKRPVM